jgi:putative ABC transport system substrate-binding protein
MRRRREFIAGLGGAAAWPILARAEQGNRMRRIGLLMPGDQNDPEMKLLLSAFTQALTDSGWTDGRLERYRHRACDEAAAALGHVLDEQRQND